MIDADYYRLLDEHARLIAEQRDKLARADARIAELVELLTECRDCVADCLNAEQNQRHSRAERADYYAGLLAQVDAALAKAGVA